MPNNVCIFEDKKFSNFFPLSLSQAVFDLRVGFGPLRARIQDDLAGAAFTLICRDYLAPLTHIKSQGLPVNVEPKGETLFINGRLLCFGAEMKEIVERVPSGAVAVKGGYVVAARLDKDAATDFASYIRKRISEDAIARLCEALRDLSTAAAVEKKQFTSSPSADKGTYEDVHAVGQDSVEQKLPVELSVVIKERGLLLVQMPEARLLSFPWQIIEFNPDVIVDDFRKLPFRGQSEESVLYPAVQMINPDDIVIGDNAVVRSGVVLDATDGPIAIGDRTVVMPNTSIVGPVSIGADCLIRTGAKILEGTSIGKVCKIGGEVEGTIFASYSNKQHDGFIGHSYIGEWVNIGAASNNSDLKNNYSPVRMWCAGAMKETGRQFMGLLMGDHTKTGINTIFNTGTVVGFNCNIYGSEMLEKFVPSYSWGHGANMSLYDITKAMQTAEVVLERRKAKFDTAHRQVFEKIAAMSDACNRNI